MGQWLLLTISLITGAVVVCVGCVYLVNDRKEQRKQLRHIAYQEGVGEEYDLELNRLRELRSSWPQDAPSGPDPYEQALENVRLQKRTREKNERTPSVQYIIVNGIVNIGTVLGDLNNSVQNLRSQGEPQIADAIQKLTDVIKELKEITDADRNDLLENLALVSKEVESPSDSRRAGLLKSSLGFVTTSLGAFNELAPLVP